MAVDLLRNRRTDILLGPFDGPVAATVRINGETYFVTTNMDYVPNIPSIQVPHALFLRSDMCYGTDNHTLWHQQWTAQYCHLPIIAKKGARPEIDIMWWDPTPADFEVGKAITRGLGCLRYSAMNKFLPHINEIVGHCKKIKDTSHFMPLFGELMQGIMLLVEQLQILPTKYNKMVFAITSLQRAWLELDALYDYTLFSRSAVEPAPAASSSGAAAQANKQQPSQSPKQQRARPYPSQAPPKQKGPAKVQRDKFSVLAIEQMPPSIAAWADALARVDRSVAPFTSDPADKQYVLPEPALLVNSSPERRRKFLPHWTLLSDGFLYMLSQPEHTQLLSAQEWRDVLEGHLTEHGHLGSRTQRLRAGLVDRLRPALEASNVFSLDGFPVSLDSVPDFTLAETREIVWQAAETSFHFEFASLDRRASKKARLDKVKACFASGMLLGVPLEMSKCGWAAPTIEERFPYAARAAKLMLD
ncbi:hypothetical protein B0H17DRAFT_1202697 [Mycena rosella]|uniref:Uncharacterized protein n=1 Tax=Mycena rosella TaxID=1033263 RepID=A0AAD7DD80_MYCRO|nr:hypothetical protein B0H17DRAFT_1202697 [Mycena rosella]